MTTLAMLLALLANAANLGCGARADAKNRDKTWTAGCNEQSRDPQLPVTTGVAHRGSLGAEREGNDPRTATSP